MLVVFWGGTVPCFMRNGAKNRKDERIDYYIDAWMFV